MLVPSMRVVSSCGCEGGVGGKEGLVEAFVKWREEEEILMFGNGMWDCDAIYCNIQESLNVHKQPEVSKRVVFHVFLNSAHLCRCRGKICTYHS